MVIFGDMERSDLYVANNRNDEQTNSSYRVICWLTGYGSQAMAFKKLGIPFEHHRVVEFDKYAINSYNEVHGTDFPALDITKIKGVDLGITNTDKFTYILTYSFP